MTDDLSRVRITDEEYAALTEDERRERYDRYCAIKVELNVYEPIVAQMEKLVSFKEEDLARLRRHAEDAKTRIDQKKELNAEILVELEHDCRRLEHDVLKMKRLLRLHRIADVFDSMTLKDITNTSNVNPEVSSEALRKLTARMNALSVVLLDDA